MRYTPDERRHGTAELLPVLGVLLAEAQHFHVLHQGMQTPCVQGLEGNR